MIAIILKLQINALRQVIRCSPRSLLNHSITFISTWSNHNYANSNFLRAMQRYTHRNTPFLGCKFELAMYNPNRLLLSCSEGSQRGEREMCRMTCGVGPSLLFQQKPSWSRPYHKTIDYIIQQSPVSKLIIKLQSTAIFLFFSSCPRRNINEAPKNTPPLQ